MTNSWKALLLSSFGIGVIFFAGAFYNRVVGIEISLGDIRSQMPALAKVAVLEERQAGLVSSQAVMQSEINRLQDELDHVKRIVQ